MRKHYSSIDGNDANSVNRRSGGPRERSLTTLSDTGEIRKGKFTLVELLVVIAIIGILASMVLPALSQAKKAGQSAVCVSNLKQIGVMLQTYANEYDGRWPWNCTTTRSESTRTFLPTVLNCDTPSKLKIFKCPDEREGLFEDEGSSYIWNWPQIEFKLNDKFLNARYGQKTYYSGGSTNTDVASGSFAVLMDASFYHGRSGDRHSFNALAAGGNVGTLADMKN
jgi:prepilin-type N-terminal cleavage/methylation domain-containing protein